jgi:hypothetical protein
MLRHLGRSCALCVRRSSSQAWATTTGASSVEGGASSSREDDEVVAEFNAEMETVFGSATHDVERSGAWGREWEAWSKGVDAWERQRASVPEQVGLVGPEGSPKQPQIHVHVHVHVSGKEAAWWTQFAATNVGADRAPIAPPHGGKPRRGRKAAGKPEQAEAAERRG